jgi:hypothetical protein
VEENTNTAKEPLSVANTDLSPFIIKIEDSAWLGGKKYQHVTADVYDRYDSLLTFQEQRRSFSVNTSTHPKELIKMAWDAYHFNCGRYATATNIMVDFSFSGIINEGETKGVEFFKILVENNDIDGIIKQILLEYYISGNVFIYREILSKGTKKEPPKVIYTILDPTLVNVEAVSPFGDVYLSYKVTNKMKEMAGSSIKEIKEMFKALPKDWQTAIKAGSKIPLDPEKTYAIYKKKMNYQEYAIPSITPGFPTMDYIQTQRVAESITAKGFINQLIVVTIGSDEFPATRAQLTDVATMLKTPSPSYMLVYDHTLKINQITPNTDVFDADKYIQPNRELSEVIGVPTSLITGEGGFSGYVMAFKVMKKMLEDGIRGINNWLKHEWGVLGEEFRVDPPSVRLDTPDLDDQATVNQLVLGLIDRGVLSVRSALESTKISNLNTEIERLTTEQEYSDLFVPRQSPYQASPSTQETPKTVEDAPGRPPNKKDIKPRNKKSDIKPPPGL